MREMIRPPASRAMCRGWLFALLGAVASLPPLLVAALSAPQGHPATLRAASFALGFAAVVAAMAFPRVARHGTVRLANRLLGTRLPAPMEPPPSRWGDRMRTSVWLAAHMAVGAAVTAMTGLWMFAAVVFPALWLGDGGRVAVFGLSAEAPHGWRGAWTLLMSAGCLAAAGYLTIGATAALRRLAPVLLGHGYAERLAAAEKQTNVLAERNRLAQDLHDSIGHTLTASTIQAAVALEMMDRDPEAARRALGSIEDTSRAAMDDLDHVLGVLRRQSPSTRPQPTLADLGSLVGRVRDSGAELSVETTGDLARVPAEVSREVYRVVQEGLTNALRHGGRTEMRLRATVGDGWLEVRLTNSVGAEPAPRDAGARGRGLAGIEERVRLLRGEVSAGPTGDGSLWQITARVPLRSAS